MDSSNFPHPLPNQPYKWDFALLYGQFILMVDNNIFLARCPTFFQPLWDWTKTTCAIPKYFNYNYNYRPRPLNPSTGLVHPGKMVQKRFRWKPALGDFQTPLSLLASVEKSVMPLSSLSMFLVIVLLLLLPPNTITLTPGLDQAGMDCKRSRPTTNMTRNKTRRN